MELCDAYIRKLWRNEGLKFMLMGQRRDQIFQFLFLCCYEDKAIPIILFHKANILYPPLCISNLCLLLGRNSWYHSLGTEFQSKPYFYRPFFFVKLGTKKKAISRYRSHIS